MIETGGGRGHHGSVHPGVLDCMRPFKVSLPFGWPGKSGAGPRSQTIARSYPGYDRAPPETKDGHPSSLGLLSSDSSECQDQAAINIQSRLALRLAGMTAAAIRWRVREILLSPLAPSARGLRESGRR